MKKSILSAIVLGLSLFAIIPTQAQEIIVQKKNGTAIKVHYSEFTSLASYDYAGNTGVGSEGGALYYEVNGVRFKMIPVKGGTFRMGATADQGNGYAPAFAEKPVHQVTLSDYYIGETEVTQALWCAVMGTKQIESGGNTWTTTFGLGDNYPAYYISYDDCREFIAKLNQLTGENFRMPTEAEWEYAARGGNRSRGYIFSGSNNIGDVAWYKDNSGNKTHAVGTKQANELGIYDMSGNVWEWCSDWYSIPYSSGAQTNPTGPSSGSGRVSRGGSWSQNATNARVSNRFNIYPNSCQFNLGLRLAR